MERNRKNQEKTALVIAAMLAGLGALGWRPAAAGAADSKAIPPAAERGQQLFVQHCSFCHGPEATGARGPDLLRSALVAHDVNGNLIGDLVRSGRPDKGMPAQNLTEPETQDIAAFLHFRANEALHSGHVSTNYPIERLLTGNADAGKAFFNGAGGCTACHSPQGDLKGIANKYAPIDLEAHMLYPRDAVQTLTVSLPDGQTVEGPLVHMDEFSVALRDGSGWYRSFQRSRVQVKVHDPLAGHQQLLNKLTQDDVHNLFAYLMTLK